MGRQRLSLDLKIMDSLNFLDLEKSLGNGRYFHYIWQIFFALEKTIVLFAHPFLEHSVFNAQVIELYKTDAQVTFRDLYEDYPDFHIAAFRERKRIKGYSKIIFHFPLIWLNIPPLLSLWMSEVLDMRWLSRLNESPLKDKRALIVVSTGGSDMAFSSQGVYGSSVDDFLKPLTKSLELTGVSIEGIVTTHTAKQQGNDAVNRVKAEIQQFLNSN